VAQIGHDLLLLLIAARSFAVRRERRIEESYVRPLGPSLMAVDSNVSGSTLDSWG